MVPVREIAPPPAVFGNIMADSIKFNDGSTESWGVHYGASEGIAALWCGLMRAAKSSTHWRNWIDRQLSPAGRQSLALGQRCLARYCSDMFLGRERSKWWGINESHAFFSFVGAARFCYNNPPKLDSQIKRVTLLDDTRYVTTTIWEIGCRARESNPLSRSL